MKKSYRILLGLATFWPIVYIGLFFVGVFSMMLLTVYTDQGASRAATQPELPPIALIGMIVFFAVHMLTILGSFGLMAYYIFHLFKTDRLDQGMKIMWTVLICMLGMMAMPVYWYLYIWRDGPPALAVAGPSQLPAASQPGVPFQGSQERREPESTQAKPPDWR